MTRWLVIVGLVLGATAAIGVDHTAASMASIVTVAPVVEDEGQAGVEAAAASALRRAVRGAQAMGLDEMMLKSIRLVPGTGVVVEIIASESNEPDAYTDGDVERSKLETPSGRARLLAQGLRHRKFSPSTAEAAVHLDERLEAHLLGHVGGEGGAQGPVAVEDELLVGV
jgi:hypothetical protein